MSFRVIFMGTPEFSVPSLSAIVKAGYEVVACYSQPPRPAGRGMGEKKSPVHQAAENLSIPVFTPKSLKSEEEQKLISSHNADVAIVIAYGLLLPQEVLDTPKLGCFNAHASKLPRWRGAAPIQRAIMAGDKETAAMIMKMEAGLDTGPIAISKNIEITPSMTAGELHDILSEKSAELTVEALNKLDNGKLTLKAQSKEGVTYAAKIEKSESPIDWEQSAEATHNHIRGLSPFPGAWCEINLNGKRQRVKILLSEIVDKKGEAGSILDEQLTIGCEDKAVRLVKLQRAGKGVQNIEEFLRGNQFEIGAKVH